MITDASALLTSQLSQLSAETNPNDHRLRTAAEVGEGGEGRGLSTNVQKKATVGDLEVRCKLHLQSVRAQGGIDVDGQQSG